LFLVKHVNAMVSDRQVARHVVLLACKENCQQYKGALAASHGRMHLAHFLPCFNAFGSTSRVIIGLHDRAWWNRLNEAKKPEPRCVALRRVA